MRLISFRAPEGNRIGARVDGDVVDLTAAYGALLADRGEADPARAEKAVPPDMEAFLAGGDAAMAAASAAIEFAAGREDLRTTADEVALLPPVPRPPKIVCVARNYGEHAAEANLPTLEHPNLFIRFPRSLIPAGAPIQVPQVSEQVDWEAELAVIIGNPGKHVPKERALDHVAGYSAFNDVSIRDWQLRVKQFGAGKNFDGSGPFGPELVTRDEIPDPGALKIELEVNGETMQSSSTAEMIFDVPSLIEHISQFATLEPGDVIATGTPAGVGHFRDPPVYLKPGDTVRVVIEKIGALENPVEAEA
jgi:2-keto-4-pentenoate hydratase/2-oxohepta-3-ene-1,7-dioic acid hydratase in catechol pathway